MADFSASLDEFWDAALRLAALRQVPDANRLLTSLYSDVDVHEASHSGMHRLVRNYVKRSIECTERELDRDDEDAILGTLLSEFMDAAPRTREDTVDISDSGTESPWEDDNSVVTDEDVGSQHTISEQQQWPPQQQQVIGDENLSLRQQEHAGDDDDEQQQPSRQQQQEYDERELRRRAAGWIPNPVCFPGQRIDSATGFKEGPWHWKEEQDLLEAHAVFGSSWQRMMLAMGYEAPSQVHTANLADALCLRWEAVQNNNSEVPPPGNALSDSGGGDAWREACFYTYKLDYSLCEDADICHAITISAADLQRRMTRFYHSTERSSPPPLDLVGLLSMFGRDWVAVFARECPPMMMIGALMALEVRLGIDLWEYHFIHAYLAGPAVALQTSQPSLSIILESGFGVSVETGEVPIRSMLELVEASPTWHHWRSTWPLDEALEHAATALVSTGHSASAGSLTLDVVVAWCREGLTWLTKLSGIMQRHSVRVFLYSKCYDDPEGELQRQALPGCEQWHVVVLRDTPNFTTDECSAYLHYLLELHDDSASSHTMFLQGDALNHSPRGLLPMVMQSIAVGTYSLPFLHLGDLRQVVSESSCRSWLVHRYSLHAEGLVSTYCCAQLIVSRDRIAQVPKVSLRAMYEDVLSNTALPSDRCSSWPAQSTHCLWLEQLWHVIFGEPADLPLRSEDSRLPIFLRMSDEESFLPMRSNSSRRYPSIMFDFDAIRFDDSAYNPVKLRCTPNSSIHFSESF
ncbi:hypothetical protein FOL46_003814 [Perkinsus olseni]|uniref:Uncharacterized protein n=1 Tax=Perkinsus olseni TaxID=32597 RepID=A0A7J6MTA9_PEROL|nr:hypothetical protein FOL46_003814 [Perkinsus olseni]